MVFEPFALWKWLSIIHSGNYPSQLLPTDSASEADVHDNPISRTDANGTSVTATYDSLDRVRRRVIAPGPGVAATTLFENFAYDGLSRRISAANNASTVTFAYNSLDTVIAETLQFAGETGVATTVCDYDGVGNLTRCVYPSGHAVTNEFDALERKFRIRDDDGLVAKYSFAGPGRVQQRAYGNDIVSTYTWNGVTGVADEPDDHGVKRISRITTTNASGVNLDRRSFAWDAVGNKIRHTDDRIGRTTDYDYDSIYRLRRSNRAPEVGSLGEVIYQYDAVGNRTTVTGGSSAGNYTMPSINPPGDRQVNQYTFSPEGRHTYDANGNLGSTYNSADGRTREYQYDYANRMVAFSDSATSVAASYVYDALGRRISKSGPEDRKYFYRGSTSVDEVDVSSGTTQSFVRGHYIDEVLKTDQFSGDRYHTTDDLYNLNLLTDHRGSPSQRLTYEDFGSPIVIDASGDVRPGELPALAHTFTGRRFDSESGLFHYRTRQLDPSLGRFTSPDRKGSWYDPTSRGSALSYVGNNPLTAVDPNGTAAIYIDFPDYLISVHGSKLPNLGHAGVVIIDDHGRTKYYEYGRYPPGDCGQIRRKIVPDVDLDEHDNPTPASLAKLLESISTQSGQRGRIEAAYVENASFSEMAEYVENRLGEDPCDNPYSLFSNSCGTFARDVIEAGGASMPTMSDPRPNSYVQEVQNVYPDVHYNPGDSEVGIESSTSLNERFWRWRHTD